MLGREVEIEKWGGGGRREGRTEGGEGIRNTADRGALWRKPYTGLNAQRGHGF